MTKQELIEKLMSSTPAEHLCESLAIEISRFGIGADHPNDIGMIAFELVDSIPDDAVLICPDFRKEVAENRGKNALVLTYGEYDFTTEVMKFEDGLKTLVDLAKLPDSATYDDVEKALIFTKWES